MFYLKNFYYIEFKFQTDIPVLFLYTIRFSGKLFEKQGAAALLIN